jgi:hypothetical protein
MCACGGGSDSPTVRSPTSTEAPPSSTGPGTAPGVRDLGSAEKRELKHEIQKQLDHRVENWAAYMRDARRECQLDDDAYEDRAVAAFYEALDAFDVMRIKARYLCPDRVTIIDVLIEGY